MVNNLLTTKILNFSLTTKFIIATMLQKYFKNKLNNIWLLKLMLLYLCFNNNKHNEKANHKNFRADSNRWKQITFEAFGTG